MIGKMRMNLKGLAISLRILPRALPSGEKASPFTPHQSNESNFYKYILEWKLCEASIARECAIAVKLELKMIIPKTALRYTWG